MLRKNRLTAPTLCIFFNMRHMAVLTSVLLSSSMLAATAATATQPPQCKSLERLVDECQSGTQPSSETRDSCDRIEAGFVALCGPLGTIGVSASAAGAVLDLLRQDYQVVPIGQTAAGAFPSHLAIGPADGDAGREARSAAVAAAGDDDLPHQRGRGDGAQRHLECRRLPLRVLPVLRARLGIVAGDGAGADDDQFRLTPCASA